MERDSHVWIVHAEMEPPVHLDDLSALPDDDLYALEGRRSLDPAEWRRVDDELRRRRQLRVMGGYADLVPETRGYADMAGEPRPVPTPTLGDLERVAASLATRLESTERSVRRLRWWVLLTPVLWALVAAGSVIAAQTLGLTTNLAP